MRAESYINRKTQQPEYAASGYYISEKFDGQRAQWDPGKQCFISRYGNTINCPQWFLNYFSGLKIPIDGELFMGYGNWDLTGIFRSQRPDETLWKKVRLILFDIADSNAGTYEARRLKLEDLNLKWNWEGASSGHVEIVPVRRAESRKDIEEEFKRVTARGGEGIMLNSPYHLYHDGKNSAILKYKQVMDDECVIVNYKMGNGRLAGKLGSFVVHPIEDGQPIKSREFSLAGINDAIRANYKHTHKIGTVLHYRCAELTKDGKPKHPVYLGICKRPVTNINLITEDHRVAVEPVPAIESDTVPETEDFFLPPPPSPCPDDIEPNDEPLPPPPPPAPEDLDLNLNDEPMPPPPPPPEILEVPDMKTFNKGIIKLNIRPRPIVKV
jgi:DNA ligase-1